MALSTRLSFDYVLARATPSYSQSDEGRARCRLSTGVFDTLNIRVGWIVQWQLSNGTQLLCTAWPDTSECFGDDSLSLDEAVCTSTSSALPASGICIFLQAYAPRIGASLHVHAIKLDKGPRVHKISAFMLGGLPISAGFAVRKSRTHGRIHDLHVTSFHPGGPCLVGFGTIVITGTSGVEEKGTTGELTANDSNSGALTSYCPTSVVREILRYIVKPSLHLPPPLQIHGLLLLGPPGVGKTFAMRAVQKHCEPWCNVHIREISISNVLTADSPIAALDSLFRSDDEDDSDCDGQRQSLFAYVVDEVDALGRGGGHDSDAQVLMKRYLFSWFDQQNERRISFALPQSKRKFIVATSNSAQDVDIGFRRGGRLEKEIEVTMSVTDRELLLASLIERMLLPTVSEAKLESLEIIGVAKSMSHRCGGFVAADIVALVTEAARLLQFVCQADTLTTAVLQNSLIEASKKIKPAALRGAVVQLPNLNYDDVIGHDEAKNSLRRMVAFSDPAKQSKARRFGVSAPGGALLHGPPGNSKTRIVMAVASHHLLPVIALSAADIYSPYVGDAEAEIRKAFRLARQCAPCVLFLDEIDAIVTDRSNSGDNSCGGGVSVEARVLATLLTEMDGIDGAGFGVFLLAATNRIDFIDSALLRKGRFHHLLHVPNPDKETRKKLVDYFAAKSPLLAVNFGVIEELRSCAAEREGMSGADVENLIREKNMELLAEHVHLRTVETSLK